MGNQITQPFFFLYFMLRTNSNIYQIKQMKLRNPFISLFISFHLIAYFMRSSVQEATYL